MTEEPAAKQPRLEEENSVNGEVLESRQDPPEIEGRPREFEQLPALLGVSTTQFGNGTIKTQTWNPAETCTSLPEFLLAFEAIVSLFLKDKVQNRPVASKVQ